MGVQCHVTRHSLLPHGPICGHCWSDKVKEVSDFHVIFSIDSPSGKERTHGSLKTYIDLMELDGKDTTITHLSFFFLIIFILPSFCLKWLCHSHRLVGGQRDKQYYNRAHQLLNCTNSHRGLGNSNHHIGQPHYQIRWIKQHPSSLDWPINKADQTLFQ